MFDMKPETLRDLLRLGSAEAHERLDRTISALDIASQAGFSRFLRMNEAAFRALHDAGATGGLVGSRMLEELSDACRADLETLDEAPARSLKWQGDPSPEAVDYIILGSRIGTNVLRRRWQNSGEPRVREADRYFAYPAHAADWRAFVMGMSARPAADADAARIMSDVNRLFGLFEAALLSSEEERDDA